MVFLKLRNCFELSLRPKKWTDLSGLRLSHIGLRSISGNGNAPGSGLVLSPLDLPEPSEEIIELTQKVCHTVTAKG